VDLEIGRYDGDAMFAIADKDGRATVTYWSDKVELFSGTPHYIDATGQTYNFLRSNDYDHEVPLGQVVSQDEALSIVEGFVLTGKPTGLSPLT
jgi:hypothetical protein